MALFGQGTVLKMPDPVVANTYIAVAEVQNVDGPGITRDSVEITHLNSDGGWREFMPGLKDGGELSFTLQFEPKEVTHGMVNGLLKQLSDSDIRVFKLVFPDGINEASSTVWDFPGFITNFSAAIPMDDKITADVTIKVAGKPTLR